MGRDKRNITETRNTSKKEKKFSSSYSDEQKEELRNIIADFNSGSETAKKAAIERIVDKVSGFIGEMIRRRLPSFVASGHYHDIYDECIVTVISLIGGYDPDQGTLTTYYTYPLIHTLSEYANSMTNHTTAYYSKIMNQIRSAKAYFESQSITPSVTDIAYHTGLSVLSVEKGLRKIEEAGECFYESAAVLDGIISQYEEPVDEKIIRKEESKHLTAAFQRLTELERKIISLRYGLLDGDTKSYLAISKIVNLPVNQVSNIVSRTLRLLRDDEELCHIYYASERQKADRNRLKDNEITFMPQGTILNLYDALDCEDSSIKNIPLAPAAKSGNEHRESIDYYSLSI